jgi:S-DNA-T family DNA segregation ATPase FtsK/SpoIIIE
MQVKLTVRTQAGFDGDIELDTSAEATVRDLAPALRAIAGGDLDATIAHGGRPLPADALLGGPGLRSGCNLTVGPTGTRTLLASSVLQLCVVGGPDAGQIVALRRGTHIVGRADSADIAIADPDISREHCAICVDNHGVSARDLGSTNGTWVNGSEILGVPRNIEFGSFIRLGNSTVTVVGANEPPAATRPDVSGTVLVNRPPRILSLTPDEPVDFPAPPTPNPRPKLQWIAALLPTVLAGGLAIGMHNTIFLAFALLTPVTMMATTASDRWNWRRSRRQERETNSRAEAEAQQLVDELLREEVRRRRRDYPDAAAVAHAVSTPDCRLWERRQSHDDFLAIRLGIADQPAQIRATRSGREIVDLIAGAVPVTVALTDGALGLAGPAQLVRGAARWVIAQLVALHSPRDLTLVALLEEPADDWRWLRWLSESVTHIALGSEDHHRVVSELLTLITARQRLHPTGVSRWSGPWTVVLIDPARTAAVVPGLRTLLDDGPAVGITVICIDEDARLLPPSCRSIARIVSETGALIEVASSGLRLIRNVASERVSLDWADRLARQLAPLRDADTDTAFNVPIEVRLLALLNMPELTPQALIKAWSATPTASSPIGVSATGPIQIDLLSDGPHILIAGSTGSGKSELLRSLVAGLAARHAPDELAFVLIDYKGGAAFAECAELPHTLGLVTDLDAHLTGRALTSLDAELRRREAAFAAASVTDLHAYGQTPSSAVQPLPRLILVVDEFASLAEELPAFLSGLIGIAQRGRSLGVHLVLATQRPGGVVSPEIKANMALRIALRVTDAGESSDVIGNDAASRIPKRQPGRAIARMAGGLVEFQTARIGMPPEICAPLTVRPLDAWNRVIAADLAVQEGKNDLQLLCEAAQQAAARMNRVMPARPWLPPLVAVISTNSLASGHILRFQVSFGLADHPARQQQEAVVHDLQSGGSIGFIGGPKSGRTTALRTFVAQASSQLSSDDLHIYVIDCASGSLRPLIALPQCGSVVTRDEPGSVVRMLTRLTEELAIRQRRLSDLGLSSMAEAHASGIAMPAVLVAIDGWEGLTALSESHNGGRTLDTALHLLRESASAGFTILIAGDRATLGIRIASALSRKFLLELVDRSDYGMAGIAAAALPATFSPGRAVSAEDGSEVQLAVLSDDPSTAAQWAAVREVNTNQPTATGPAPMTVRPLPNSVTFGDISTADLAADMVVHSSTDGDLLSVLLGVGGDEAKAVTIDLSAGDGRFLIAGPARSGRSYAAIAIATQTLTRGGRLMIAASKRSPLAIWAERSGVAVLNPTDDPSCIQNDQVSGGWVTDLLLIDDAELFTDTPIGDALAALIARQPTGAAVVATARSDDLMVSFRGIAVDIRRSGTGVLLQPTVADGDLFGIRVDRARGELVPGRGLLVSERHRPIAPEGLPIQLALSVGAGCHLVS